MSNKGKFVVVTTDSSKRGVFAGELVGSNRVKKDSEIMWIVKLKNARMAVYWSSATRGVLGLASIGPQKGSRISPSIPAIELEGVTSIMDCTEKAKKLWESEPWN